MNGTPGDAMLAAAPASRAEDRNSIDLAVISGLKDSQALSAYRVTHFQPFGPVRNRTEAAGRGAEVFRVTKRASQVILDLVSPDTQTRNRVEGAVKEFSARGFRSLALARGTANGEWKMLGIVPFFDPVREDSRNTIETARRMGIAGKMVTGDQVAIAKETAGQLGIGRKVLVLLPRDLCHEQPIEGGPH